MVQKGAIVGNELVLYRETGTETYPIQTITTEVDGVSVVDHARVDTNPPVIWENPLKAFGLAEADDVARGAELHSIYRAIVEETEPEYGALNGRTDQEILIAIRESARNGGQPIDLPLTEATGHEEHLHREYRERYGVDPFDPIEKQKEILFPQRGVVWAVR